jgi:hypothetical protein
MPARRSFKTDESFLEKLAIGAFGTRAVFGDLSRQGHKPIELERGSMGYKIWKNIKIKRLRVPDVLCLSCGTRVEARAKTQLEISMSHSQSDPERGWDKGLQDHDVVALAICKKVGEGPTDWQASPLIQYVAASDLRKAFKREEVVLEKPKGAGEGFELRVTWPSAIASSNGTVANVTASRLQFVRAADSRMISLSLTKKGIALRAFVRPKEAIREGQILASVAPVRSEFLCSRSATAETFLGMLRSSAVADRYTGAKALSYCKGRSVIAALTERVLDEREHVYVRLESAASLARMEQGAGMDFIRRTLQHEYLEHRLEAVIILGEIQLAASVDALTEVLLDKDQHPEIRAGAAWALGELQQPSSVDALMQSFLEIAEPIRIEAARALRKIATATEADIISRLPGAQQDQRAGIAWAASRAGRVDVEKILPAMVDDDARRWGAYILGVQDPQTYAHKVEALRQRDPEVYFAVTVLWQILSSWIYNLEEY